MLLCFFFKQKTAYEMRISDWSSDVCSSDLSKFAASQACLACSNSAARLSGVSSAELPAGSSGRSPSRIRGSPCGTAESLIASRKKTVPTMVSVVRESIVVDAPSASITAGESSWNPPTSRSEEHTSELQSLMRISYAVFCLKKKNQNPH